MTGFIRHFLLAIQFFTRLPVTGRLAEWVGYSPAMLRASVGHFPAVGLVVGGWSAAVFAAVWALLPDTPHTGLVAASVSTAASVWLTGGFHEDGLADVADGLGGSYQRERALEIMKDSRIGAFGAMALVLALLTKVALLATLAHLGLDVALTALMLGHVVSRTWPLLTIRLLQHVGDAAGSKSKPLADQVSNTALLTGFLWFFCASPLILYSFSAIEMSAFGWSLLCSGVAWGYVARLLHRRLAGFTGDGLGTTQQLCELACLFGVLIALGAGA